MKSRALLMVCLLSPGLFADEGLWLFNQFPKDQVKQKYNLDLPDALLERLRLASLRIGDGAGSFVSANGLVVTTYTVAAACAAKAGPAGFYAANQGAEARCPGLEGEVLVALEDVTKQVKEAAPANAKAAELLQKRNAAIARIEKSCADKTGNHCAVVKLFSGERYDLYQYKRYNDLRLVFAPERSIATFGGDAAIFTFPRYAFDVAFLRAYENGKPADSPHFLTWSAEGVKDLDLVFAATLPRSTSRLATAAQLQFYSDTSVPLALTRLQNRIQVLRAFAAKSPESQRAALPLLTELDSAYKSTAGRLIGLKDDRLMARKQNFERKLRSAVEHDPKLGTDAGKVWDEVATAYKNWSPSERPFQVLERPAAQGSTLFQMARQIVRLAEERGKPNEQSLAEYREGAIPALESALSSPTPVDEALETAMLVQYLEELRALGEREAPVKAILNGRTPQQVATDLVHNSKLGDAAERKRLVSDRAQVQKSEDSMIRLARQLEDPSRKLLKKHSDTIESLEASSAERIAQYRFKVFGASDYPDATSTPRAAFGSVKAYRDKTEAPVPFATTFGGLFHLAGKQEPYVVPQRWMDAKAQLDLVMPFDFASTCDIPGGSPGSPTVNAKGELVGIAFDGNIESIANTYLYTEDQPRAVHVASQGIVEVLRKIYKTPELLRELGVAEAGPPALASR